MENPPPAEPNGAYTLDLKTGNGQLFVGSNPTPSANLHSLDVYTSPCATTHLR